jgi:hypothetical protein
MDEEGVVMKEESHRAETPDLEQLPEEMQEALARAGKAMEELPPLEELAALQEAMLGLAEMGALLRGMRVPFQGPEEAVEKPAEAPEDVDP